MVALYWFTQINKSSLSEQVRFIIPANLIQSNQFNILKCTMNKESNNHKVNRTAKTQCEENLKPHRDQSKRQKPTIKERDDWESNHGIISSIAHAQYWIQYKENIKLVHFDAKTLKKWFSRTTLCYNRIQTNYCHDEFNNNSFCVLPWDKL